MTDREVKMYQVLRGIAVNATHCTACQMMADIARNVLAEIDTDLAKEEAAEAGLVRANPV